MTDNELLFKARLVGLTIEEILVELEHVYEGKMLCPICQISIESSPLNIRIQIHFGMIPDFSSTTICHSYEESTLAMFRLLLKPEVISKLIPEKSDFRISKAWDFIHLCQDP